MSILFSCKKASRLASDAMDRKLPPSELLQLRFHLLICSLCRRFTRQLKFTRQAVRHAADPEALPDLNPLSTQAKERMKEALRREE